MKKNILAVACLLGILTAHSVVAAAEYGIALEYEAEKEKVTGDWSDTAYIIPSFTVTNSPVLNKVELLLGYSQPRASGAASATALGVRLRKDFAVARNVNGFVRAAVGHSTITGADYSWGYIEPGLEVKINRTFGFAISDRVQNSIDGKRGMSVSSLRVGPNIELDEYSELELRYISTTGDYESESYMAEYRVNF
jgi:hypothetical protein